MPVKPVFPVTQCQGLSCLGGQKPKNDVVLPSTQSGPKENKEGNEKKEAKEKKEGNDKREAEALNPLYSTCAGVNGVCGSPRWNEMIDRPFMPKIACKGINCPGSQKPNNDIVLPSSQATPSAKREEGGEIKEAREKREAEALKPAYLTCAGVNGACGSPRWNEMIDRPFMPKIACKGINCPGSQKPKNDVVLPSSQATPSAKKEGGEIKEASEKREAEALRFAGPPKNAEEAERRRKMEQMMSSNIPINGQRPHATVTANEQLEKREALKIAARPGCKGTFEACYPEVKEWKSEGLANPVGKPWSA